MSGVFINSDAWNFWTDSKCIETDPAKAIRDDVDFYADAGGVEAVFYNMNFSRSFLNTKVGTPIWKDCTFDAAGNLLLRGFPLKKADSDNYGPMVRRAKAMHEKMPDFMQYRYDYCHKKGIEMWHSMRMNDVHHSELGGEFKPQHCDLWLDHKEMLRAWYRHTWRGYWIDNGFDYGRRDVYEYHLNLAREYLLDYESDGIELDWMRAMPVFKPGYDELNMEILTNFMRDVKAAAIEAEKKWGHRIRIAARTPYQPQEAYALGMDVGTWAAEGLVDVLIPSPNGLCMEQDAQLKLWRAIAPGLILAPCVDYVVVSNRENFSRQAFTKEIDCGMISTYYAQGADTIYFYNHFPRHEHDTEPRIREIFPAAADREKAASLPRRHVITAHDSCVEGLYNAPCFPAKIWEKCSDGGVRIHAGERTAGRKGVILIGSSVPLNVNVLLNTVYCDPVTDFELPQNFKKGGNGMQHGSFWIVPGNVPEIFWTCVEIPQQALHDGWNNVELYNHDSHIIESKEILWMELNLA